MTRIALVTGAAGGIGSAVVRALLEEGHRVVATDVDGDALGTLRDGMSEDDAPGDGLRREVLDVSKEDDVEALVASVEASWGPIDWGVNVAGVFTPSPVLDSDLDDWRRIFGVNLFGVLLVSRALGRRMAERGRGALVTVGSNAGMLPRTGMGAYGSSKAAASMLTRTLGLELAPHGVRCNVVAPGSTRTPMQTRYQSDAGGEERVVRGSLEDFRTGIPLGRIADPEDVAECVLFLLSDRARHVTMTELVVDGGASLLG